MALPGKEWAVDIPVTAFKLPDTSTNPYNKRSTYLRLWIPGTMEALSDDGRKYSLSLFRSLGDTSQLGYARLTVRLQPAEAPGGPAQLRDFTLKKFSKRDDVKQSSIKALEHNQIPAARYTAKQTRDGDNGYTGSTPITEFGPHSMEGYFVKDDVWITVTVTASPFDAAQENLFYSLLDSVTLTDTSAPTTSFDYYHKGRVWFLAKNYQRALDHLKVAWSLEQAERKLDVESWRDLIGKLADSYGTIVDRERAKEVLQYGISKDPTNYSFHMGLARLFASLGDIDNTLASLEQAFLYMKKDTAKVWLPDLRNDPAFARYMKIDRFRKAVEQMRKS